MRATMGSNLVDFGLGNGPTNVVVVVVVVVVRLVGTFCYQIFNPPPKKTLFSLRNRS